MDLVLNRSKFTNGFNIRNQSGRIATIDIAGIIGGGWWNDGDEISDSEELRAELKAISAIKAEKIIVNIESPGGLVNHALAMHDLLAQHEAEIEVNIYGMTASSATVIAMAGDIIRMSDNALFLVHRITGISIGNGDKMRQNAEDVDTVEDRLINIYKKRTGNTRAHLKKLMNKDDGEGIWMDAKEAKKEGFISEIFEPMAMAAFVNPKTLKFLNLPKIDNSLKSNTMEIKELKTFIDLITEKFNAHADDRDEAIESIVAAAECDTADVERILDDGEVESTDTIILTAIAEEIGEELTDIINEANGDGGEETENLFENIWNWFTNKFRNDKVTKSELKKHSKTLAAKLEKQFNDKIKELEDAAETAEEKHEKAIGKKDKEIKALKQKANGKNAKGLTLDNIDDPDAGSERANTTGKDFVALLTPSQINKLEKNKKED